ncbi:MAG: hypothetical protein ACRC6B_10295 [Fusobacteriaceae bacterium]
MKKLASLVLLVVSLSACSSLKTMNAEHISQRRELRKEQTVLRKELGVEHKAESKIINDEHLIKVKELGAIQKKESKVLSDKSKKQRELLKAKQSLQFAIYGTKKYTELKELIGKLESILK